MRLSDYIQMLGINCSEAARQLGYSAQAVSNWINGSRIPRETQMRNIIRWSNSMVTPNDFYEVKSLTIGGETEKIVSVKEQSAGVAA